MAVADGTGSRGAAVNLEELMKNSGHLTCGRGLAGVKVQLLYLLVILGSLHWGSTCAALAAEGEGEM